MVGEMTRNALPAVLAAAILLAATGACGDDGGDPGDDRRAASVRVTAADYEFRGVPESVPTGARLELANASRAEVHELVAVRLPDGETRAVDEILQLPEEKLGRLLSDDAVATVLVAAPESAGSIMVGDGTLDRPGRYAIVCFLPTGADPDQVMQAVEAFDPKSGEEPQLPTAGPPHIVHGMFTELTVR